MIYTGLPDRIILCRGMRQVGRPTHRHTVFGKYGQAPEAGLCMKIMVAGGMAGYSYMWLHIH